MKLAILISGQPRNIYVAYESLKKYYLDKYDCDVFIHTWFDEKFQTQQYSDLLNLFKPKKILIEDQIIFDSTGLQDPIWSTTLQNLASMNYSIFIANKLKSLYEEERNFKYDFVMRMRTDLKITRPIELEKIDKDKLAIYNWTESNVNSVGYSDVFAIGTSPIMDVYSNLYNKLSFYLNDDQSYVIPGKMRPEYVLRHHIETVNKIPIQLFWHGDHSDPSFYLIR